jgi:hypothetical protein
MKMEQSVPKHRHIKFRHWGIAQKETYNMFKIVTSSGINLQETQVKQIAIIFNHLLFINITLYVKQSY